MEKTQKLNIITGIVLAGFIIAVIYHFILGTFLHLEYPYNTFLFISNARFSDFTDIFKLYDSTDFNPYLQFHNHANHFPFGMFFMYLFRLIPILLSFLLFNFIYIGYFLFYNFNNIKQILPSKIIFSTLILSLCSFPFLILFDRGNYEGFVFLFLSLFVYFFSKEKYTKSALMLAIPIAMKGFPVLLLPLFWAKKRFKEFFYCIGFSFLLTIVPLVMAKGGIIPNILCFLKHLGNYFSVMAINNGGLGFGSSLFGIVKFIIFWLNGCFKLFPHQIGDTAFYFYSFLVSENNYIYGLVSRALGIFTPIAGILTLLVIIYVIFVEKEFWKQVLLLIICTIIFTPVSGDYKLLHLYIPMWLFIKSENKSKSDWIYAILFGLILIPKNYLQFIEPSVPNSFFSISIVIDPLILTIMLVMIIKEGFYKYNNIGQNNKKFLEKDI